MLVGDDADPVALPATMRVHGSSRALRVAPVWTSRRGMVRRALALIGMAFFVALVALTADSISSAGLFGWFMALWSASVAFSLSLAVVGGPFRTLRFGRGGVRRGREPAPQVVRAVLVEEAGCPGPVIRTRRHRVVYVDARWRQRIVAWFPEPRAAHALGHAIHQAVLGVAPTGVPLEFAPRATRIEV